MSIYIYSFIQIVTPFRVMRKIIINERQERKLHLSLLKEYMQFGFSFGKLDETLAQEQTRKDREKTIEWLKEVLNDPIGEGSSRITFDVADGIVLKLATKRHGDAGVAQNRAEYQVITDANSWILPKIYKISANGDYLVSEAVVQCVSDINDLGRILGIDACDYLNHGGVHHPKYREMANNKDSDFSEYDVDGNKTIGELDEIIEYLATGETDFVSPITVHIAETQPWCKELKRLKDEFDIDVYDLNRLENWGIAMRNGKPTAVVLDCGLTNDVWKKYY